ncbi:MAG: hypothetical protein WC369_02125 [Dehalococcoidales bacterium]|jgi:hypothetical protein
MANEKTLEVILQLKDELSKKLSDANLKMNNFGDAVSKAAKIAAGAFAANKVLSFTEECLDSYSQQEAALRKLQTALNNSGHSWESSSVKINQYLETVKETTTFSNNEATEALQEMMVYTEDLEKATDGSRLAMNMAASGLFDLSSATRYVGMAMEGNIEVLGRYIPELRASSNEQLDSMSSAEKATYALNMLQQKFGGMAAGELETYAGQVKKLKNSFGEIKEGIGQLAVKWLNLTQVGEYWSKFIDNLLQKQNTALSPGMAQLTKRLQEVNLVMNELNQGPKTAVITAKIAQLQQERLGLIQLMHKLQNTELTSSAEENYGAEMAALEYGEEFTRIMEEQYTYRLGMKQDFMSESEVLSSTSSQKEFENQLWLYDQLALLGDKELSEKSKSAAEKVKIAEAAAKAEAEIQAKLYDYQAQAAASVARIFTAAAQITGNSWINAAGIIIKGFSQVMSTMSKLKAMVSPNPWDKVLAVLEIAAIAAETASALKALEDSKKQIADLTVEEFNTDIPQAAAGAIINKGGLIRVHDDERVTPAQVSPLSSAVAGGNNITVYISISEAKLNSPSNMKEFVSELMDEIDYLTNRQIGRPRTAF